VLKVTATPASQYFQLVQTANPAALDFSSWLAGVCADAAARGREALSAAA